MLRRLVGGDILSGEFKKEQGVDYNEMMRDLERKKKLFKSDSTETINTRFPTTLKDIIIKQLDCSIDDLIIYVFKYCYSDSRNL